MEKEEKAYEIFMDALHYRRGILTEKLQERYLPESLSEEYREKLDGLNKLHDLMF